MKPAFLLARVSTWKQSQDQSPDRQIENLRTYCERQAWKVAYEDTDRASGMKGEAARPALAHALTLARRGEIGAICVTRLDRLGRSLRNLIDTADELRRLGVDLVVLDMNIDTTTPGGKFMFQIIAACAEFQRDLYAEAAAEGQARARAAGKHCARPPEPVQPAAVEEIERLRAAGYRWKLIPAALAERGWKQWGRVIKSTGRTRADRPWPVSSLKAAYNRNRKPPVDFGREPSAESGPGQGSRR
jgi:DNA invertase Pin-like site-specific DNA recombinase